MAVAAAFEGVHRRLLYMSSSLPQHRRRTLSPLHHHHLFKPHRLSTLKLALILAHAHAFILAAALALILT